MIFDQHDNPAPRFTPPRPDCAGWHNDPTTWRSSGFDDRGYERLTCTHCRRLIGYRPPLTKKELARQTTREMGGRVE